MATGTVADLNRATQGADYLPAERLPLSLRPGMEECNPSGEMVEDQDGSGSQVPTLRLR